MSSPRSAISAISFCDCEITTAMSVFRMKLISRDHEVACSGVRSPRRASLLVALEPLRPEPLHLVEGAHGGDLVDGHHQRLAGEAAPEEVLDDVLRDSVQAVVAGDQLVLLPESAGELAFLRPRRGRPPRRSPSGRRRRSGWRSVAAGCGSRSTAAPSRGPRPRRRSCRRRRSRRRPRACAPRRRSAASP